VSYARECLQVLVNLQLSFFIIFKQKSQKNFDIFLKYQADSNQFLSREELDLDLSSILIIPEPFGSYNMSGYTSIAIGPTLQTWRSDVTRSLTDEATA